MISTPPSLALAILLGLGLLVAAYGVVEVASGIVIVLFGIGLYKTFRRHQ